MCSIVPLFIFFVHFIHKECLGIDDIILMEEWPVNTKIYELKRLVPNSKMIYNLLNNYNAHSYFIIRNDILYTNRLIDMDSMCENIGECCNRENYSCDFFIGIVCRENVESTLILKKLKLTIQDKNDNYPIFMDKNLELEISENLKVGMAIPLPIATDNDFGMNRIETYEISRQEPNAFDQYFRLNILKQTLPMKVELKLNRPLDRETISKYSFYLLAIDGGYQDRKTGSINIIIKIKDENDNMPQFTKSLYKETVKEGIMNTMPILKVKADDPDENLNGKVIYRLDPNNKNDGIVKDNFTINEETGEIFLKRPLDYEKQHSIKFVVIATNPTPVTILSSITSSATVEIQIENVYDERLNINIDYLKEENYSIIEENKSNIFIALVTVNSKEAEQFRSSINCHLESYTKYLSLILKPNEYYKYKTYEVRNIIEIDREELPKIDTKVVCKDTLDSNVQFSSAILRVLIKDQNDNAPKISIVGDKILKENTSPGTVVLTVKAVDDDEGENGRVMFTMDKSPHQTLEYLTIGETDGIVQVKKSIDCESNFGQLTSLAVTVTSSDHGIIPRSTDLKFNIDIIDINDNPPKFIINPMIFSVPENGPSHSSIGEIEVEDKDAKDEITVEFIHSKSGILFPFYIFKNSKKLFLLNTTRPLDREKEHRFHLNVIASDGRGPRSHTVTGSIEVEVLDVNDNHPVIIFPQRSNTSDHTISYKEPKNYKFMTVSASDQDHSKEFSILEFQIDGIIDIFDIDRRDGVIYTRRDMTFQDIGEHHIKVTVSNTGTPILKSSVNINIIVDKSPPKSNIIKSESFNSDKSNYSVNIIGGGSEVVISVLIICTILASIAIIVIVVFALRYYNKRPEWLHNFFNGCFNSDIGTEDNTTIKTNMKNDLDYYNNQKGQLFEKPLLLKESSDNWKNSNNIDDNYNGVFNGNPYRNPSNYYLQHHTYHTIEDPEMLNKYPDSLAFQTKGKYENNYKSEMNINASNLFCEPNQEPNQTGEFNKMKWISSLTPLPTRSKCIINRVIQNEENVNNFAVAYPQEQSTFV